MTSKIISMEDYRYRIVPGMVEGLRCWGCCQENCQRCSCSCHQPVNGWKLVKGTRVVWTSEHKQELVNNLKYYIERDKEDEVNKK